MTVKIKVKGVKILQSAILSQLLHSRRTKAFSVGLTASLNHIQLEFVHQNKNGRFFDLTSEFYFLLVLHLHFRSR